MSAIVFAAPIATSRVAVMDAPDLELWVWWACDPQGGWTQIAAQLPGFEHLGAIPLSHRRLDVAQSMRAVAEAHARHHNQVICLQRMGTVETVEQWAPPPQG